MSNINGYIPFRLTLKELAAQRDGQLVSAAKAGSGDGFAELQRFYARRFHNTPVQIIHRLGSRSREWRRAPVTALREMLPMTVKRTLCAIMLSGSFIFPAFAQQDAVSVPAPGTVSGTVTDVNDGIVPGADVVLQDSVTGETRSSVSGDNGSYAFDNVRSGVTYHVTMNAAGFVPWTSPAFTVGPGQFQCLTASKLQFSGQAFSVTVYASSEPV